MQGSEFWLCYRPFGGDCDAVRMVNEARAAIVRDTVDTALSAGFDPVRVFSTVALDGLSIERTRARESIGDLVAGAASGVERPVCYAASGMPAMTVEDWSEVLARLASSEAVSNRMFSCDWVGVPKGRLLAIAEGETVDNRFALRLRDGCSLDVTQFERSARSLLDVDTPTDLAVLAVCAEVNSLELGPNLSAVLEAWSEVLGPAVARAADVFDVMTMQDVELFLSGRISGSDWAVVDRNTLCRVRVLSEERGLRTRGGNARSLLGRLYESLGAVDFVAFLGEVGMATVWDSRPFFSHLGWAVSRGDRFRADLGFANEIEHPLLRELVSELDGRRVLMGGHSLVSGGMLAGIDAAWSRLDLRQELSG